MSRIAKVDVSEWDPELRDMTHADKATSVERGGLNILAHRPEIAKGSMVAGLTPTAGGVVFTGTTEGDFLALDAKSGEVLYRFNTGGAIAGAPSTYLAGGKQYVVVPSGTVSRSLWSLRGAATVFLFALP